MFHRRDTPHLHSSLCMTKGFSEKDVLGSISVISQYLKQTGLSFLCTTTFGITLSCEVRCTACTVLLFQHELIVRGKNNPHFFTLACLSAEVGGVGVSRETGDPSVFPTAVVTTDVIVVRGTVTVGTLVPFTAPDSEPHSQSDPPIRSVSVVHLSTEL